MFEGERLNIAYFRLFVKKSEIYQFIMKKTIVAIMGGYSKEREVSLVTGRAICKNLDKTKYKVIPLDWGKDGKFYLCKNGRKQFDLFGNRKKIDKVFIALHGTGGEDGCIQGLLECFGISYTGSDVVSSAVAMNKVLSAGVYRRMGILTPDFIDFKKGEWLKEKKKIIGLIKKKIGFPLVIKPVDQGSSVGVYIIRKEKELIPAIKKSFQTSNWLMAQKFVKGEEATCGVLEKNGKAFALPPTRIVANAGKFYDYKSKYKTGGSTHICPADFKPAINKKIQDLAVRSHRGFDCCGMSRTDFFVTPKNKIYAIEINTIPGMTPMSLLPEAAGKMGVSFSKMLDLIIMS